ncbi:SDR family NAD(P)-dependent oxidoreductase [Streptomyces sp. NPDC048441]|uniref:SDR family NAD(P)-dependent oxidoreductase n=1 Tax=Streptomyces sp. NPDC048441 TaxID=3365552 RepID=UPI00371E1F1F
MTQRLRNRKHRLPSPAEDTTAEEWRRGLEVNLTGPFLLSRALGTLMVEAGSGSIVNVATIASLHGVADRAAYNARKHGLIGLTRTLVAERGGRGVRANAVCPGWVKTEMDAADQAPAAMRTPTSRTASRWPVSRPPRNRAGDGVSGGRAAERVHQRGGVAGGRWVDVECELDVAEAEAEEAGSGSNGAAAPCLIAEWVPGAVESADLLDCTRVRLRDEPPLVSG